MAYTFTRQQLWHHGRHQHHHPSMGGNSTMLGSTRQANRPLSARERALHNHSSPQGWAIQGTATGSGSSFSTSDALATLRHRQHRVVPLLASCVQSCSSVRITRLCILPDISEAAPSFITTWA